MKKIILSLSLIGYAQIDAQLGIRNINEPLPDSYIFPHPSAALDLLSTSKGLLLPRVKLATQESLTNNVAPIINPNKGLIIFNQDSNTKKGIYIWESDPIDNREKYNKIYTFNETPKFIDINLKNDLKILENANAGIASYFTSSNETIFDWYTGNPDSYNTILELNNGYFDKARLANFNNEYFGQIYGIILPKGSYTINLNYKLKTKQEYLTNRSEAISTSTTNGNYYDIGYFADLDIYPLIDGNFDFYTGGSMRSETHTLSILDKINHINFFNTLTFDTETFVVFNIGRMQGTSYNDAVDLLAGSNIKITKISY